MSEEKDGFIRRRTRKLHALLLEHKVLAKELKIRYKHPLGSGTRGVVYATTHPDIVVKISTDEREPLAAQRLQTLKLSHVVKVHASFVKKLSGTNVVFTYLERMDTLPTIRVAAQEHFHENFHPVYHKPRLVLESLAEAIDERKAPRKYRDHLREYRALIQQLVKAGEWHRDLKTPNLMLNHKGALCVTDIGSFTEKPLIVLYDPPVVIQEIEEIADKIAACGLKKSANTVRRFAETSFKKKDPRGRLGPPDPHHDDSELSNNDSHYLPEELLHDTSPTGSNWRVPVRRTDTRKETRRTVDVTNFDRSKMNGDKLTRSPLRKNLR